jgi:hypothetical protein
MGCVGLEEAIVGGSDRALDEGLRGFPACVALTAPQTRVFRPKVSLGLREGRDLVEAVVVPQMTLPLRFFLWKGQGGDLHPKGGTAQVELGDPVT